MGGEMTKFHTPVPWEKVKQSNGGWTIRRVIGRNEVYDSKKPN